jgi:oligopeptide transport system substrate-binding protein
MKIQGYSWKVKRFCFSLLLIIVIGMQTGCGGSTSSSQPVTVAPTPLSMGEEQTKTQGVAGSGGTLIMTLGAEDPANLDPALVGDSTSAFLASQLFSGLVQFDNELNVQPDLAERWDVSNDGKTYTFYLRGDAQFADGTPITSKDVRYSLERATDPNLSDYLPARTYLGDIVGVREKVDGKAEEISGVKVIDQHTVQITIDSPKKYFLSKLVHPTAYVVERKTVEGGGADWYKTPNGSGPFDIEEWQTDRLLILKRNEKYYGELAHLDRVTFLMGAAASNPLVLYEQDKIDVTYVNSFALARVQDTNNLLSKELVSVPQLSITYIGMNVALPPFDDPLVRQAFSMLIDKARYAEVSLHGSVESARGILPPGMPGYTMVLPESNVNIERAKELLKKSKYGSAETFPPIVAYGGEAIYVLRDILEEEFGITMEIRSFEKYSEYLETMNASELPMYSTGWIADYPDPENFLSVLFHSASRENHSLYSNPEVDALLEQAAIAESDGTRWKLYQDVERRILDDAPVIPLYHDVDHMLVKPYVKGLVLTPMGIQDLSTVELVR